MAQTFLFQSARVQGVGTESTAGWHLVTLSSLPVTLKAAWHGLSWPGEVWTCVCIRAQGRENRRELEASWLILGEGVLYIVSPCPLA